MSIESLVGDFVSQFVKNEASVESTPEKPNYVQEYLKQKQVTREAIDESVKTLKKNQKPTKLEAIADLMVGVGAVVDLASGDDDRKNNAVEKLPVYRERLLRAREGRRQQAMEDFNLSLALLNQQNQDAGEALSLLMQQTAMEEARKDKRTKAFFDEMERQATERYRGKDISIKEKQLGLEERDVATREKLATTKVPTQEDRDASTAEFRTKLSEQASKEALALMPKREDFVGDPKSDMPIDEQYDLLYEAKKQRIFNRLLMEQGYRPEPKSKDFTPQGLLRASDANDFAPAGADAVTGMQEDANLFQRLLDTVKKSTKKTLFGREKVYSLPPK